MSPSPLTRYTLSGAALTTDPDNAAGVRTCRSEVAVDTAATLEASGTDRDSPGVAVDTAVAAAAIGLASDTSAVPVATAVADAVSVAT